MKHQARKKHDYHTWANDRIFEHLKSLPAEVYNREIKSVFSSISEVIYHIYQVDGMWLSVMSGDPFDKTMKVIQKLEEKGKGKEMLQMHNLYRDLSEKYTTFFDKQDLDEVITINHPRYGTLDTPVSELVNHVVNHGTYHRGNITAMLRQQNHKGVPTDYIFYVYQNK